MTQDFAPFVPAFETEPLRAVHRVHASDRIAIGGCDRAREQFADERAPAARPTRPGASLVEHCGKGASSRIVCFHAPTERQEICLHAAD